MYVFYKADSHRNELRTMASLLLHIQDGAGWSDFFAPLIKALSTCGPEQGSDHSTEV